MSPRTTAERSHQGIAIGFIIVAAASRLLPHPWNVSPVTALALFGGAALSRRWAVGIPLAAVIASDLVLGLYDSVLFTWGAFALVGMIGWWLGRRITIGRLASASLAGSLVFFLISNFGTWLLGDGGTMYPKTLEGVRQCYIAALPFFRSTVAGDLIYTGGIFGLYALAARGRPVPAVAPSTRA